MKKIRSILAAICAILFFAEYSYAQMPQRRFGFRMYVRDVISLSDGHLPFDSLAIKKFQGGEISCDKNLTLVSSHRYIPKNGMTLGTEFLLKTWHYWSLNANAEVFFQGNPSETVSSSKWLGLRTGLSSNFKICEYLVLNCKVAYSIMESNFYSLYDDDSLPSIRIHENRLTNPDHTPAISDEFNPSYIAFKRSSGFSSGCRNNTLSTEVSLRLFPKRSRFYFDLGASAFWHFGSESAVYFSGFVSDGRVNKGNHDIPQGFKEYNSRLSALFNIHDPNFKSLTNVYIHFGVGVSLFGVPDTERIF